MRDVGAAITLTTLTDVGSFMVIREIGCGKLFGGMGMGNYLGERGASYNPVSPMAPTGGNYVRFALHIRA